MLKSGMHDLHVPLRMACVSQERQVRSVDIERGLLAECEGRKLGAVFGMRRRED
jgi:hypothetical protein